MKSFFTNIQNKVSIKFKNVVNSINNTSENTSSDSNNKYTGDIYEDKNNTNDKIFDLNKCKLNSDEYLKKSVIENQKNNINKNKNKKNIISIEEDDEDFTYNINQNIYEEYEEEEEEEEEELEIEQKNINLLENNSENNNIFNINNNVCINNKDELNKINNNINYKIINNLQIFNSKINKDINKFINTSPQRYEKKNKLSIKKRNSNNSSNSLNDNNLSFFCNVLLPRNSLIDIESIELAKCYKRRAKNNFTKFISSIGIEKSNDFVYQNYYVYLDNAFMYFIKDIDYSHTIIDNDYKINKNRTFIKKVSKRHSLLKLNQIKVSDFEDKVKVVLVFKFHDINMEFEDERYEIKDLYFSIEEANIFFSMLRNQLLNLKIDLNIPNV